MINQLKQRRTAVFLLAVLALVGGLVTGRSLLYNLAYLFGLLLITSFLWAWVNINGVHLSRVTRAQRTQVGRPLEERFTVRNTSIIPKLWLEVRDHSDVPGHQTSYVVNNLRPRQAFNWRTTTVCRERGRYQLGPITMRTSDPFGLFIMTKKLTPTSNVVIYPLTYDIQQFALPVGILPGGDALRRRTHYITTNASGVRDYAPGDSFSRIHWPSTARRNRMIVKEFELDPLADIWIILDMAAFGHIKSAESKSNSDNLIEDIPGWMRAENQFSLPETTEEYTVTAAASIAQYFIRSDRAVGMLAYGQSNELVQPDRGERQFTRILETLAVLRAQGHVPIDDMLHAESHLFPRGTTLIIVTPTNQEQWVTSARQLVRRGLRVVTILIDPESFGAKRTNAGLETMLHGNGMAAYRIRCGDDITAVLNQARSQSGYFIL
ncbi:MAG: DUF58 domain-containing protein [Chloroflexi bacterium]|nr:MAG: DUF58 domain-containing protein [Chloroflexota bacterium]